MGDNWKQIKWEIGSWSAVHELTDIHVWGCRNTKLVKTLRNTIRELPLYTAINRKKQGLYQIRHHAKHMWENYRHCTSKRQRNKIKTKVIQVIQRTTVTAGWMGKGLL